MYQWLYQRETNETITFSAAIYHPISYITAKGKQQWRESGQVRTWFILKLLCSMFNISTFHFTTKNSPIEMEKNLKHVCMFAALGERDLI